MVDDKLSDVRSLEGKYCSWAYSVLMVKLVIRFVSIKL
jgi:hypothetical protein